MNELQVLEYWKSLIKDKEIIEIWNEILNEDDDFRKVPEGFFSIFRPNGKGLEKIFSVVNKGDEIFKRILEIYEATSGDYDGSDWYFVVRRPKITSKENIEGIAKQFVKNIIEMAEETEDEYFDSFINNPPEIKIIEGELSGKEINKGDDFYSDLYELRYEYIEMMEEEESHALLFKEPLYQMACSYETVYYVLWPLYDKESKIKDPFKPFVDLWKLNITYQLDVESNVLRFFVKEMK